MNLFRRVLGYLRPYLWLEAGAFLAMLVAQAAMYVTPILTMNIVDNVVGRRDVRLLALSTGGMIVAIVIVQVFRGVTQYLTSLVTQRVLVDMRRDLFDRSLRTRYALTLTRQTGDVVSRLVNDLSMVAGLVGQTLIDVSTNILTVIGGIAVMVYLNWRLAGASLTVLPLVVLTFALFQRRYYVVGMKLQRTTGLVSAYATSALQGQREIKTFGNERLETENLLRRMTLFLNASMERAWVTALSGGIIQIACGMGQVIVFMYGGYQAIMGRATLGQIIAFTNYLGFLYGPAQQLTVINLSIKSTMAAAQRAFEVMDLPAEDDSGRRALSHSVSEVNFEDVWFGYSEDKPVLKGCALRARKGEMVALVGASGSGKTTLISLLPRLYDPWRGRVTLDGVDVRDFSLASLRSRLGVVSQDIFLFDASLIENVRYGRPTASPDDVRRACAAAHLDEIAAELPHGYDEVLGERALRLSAGQRQRISLARVVLRDPEVIILDEATSALDSESETTIRETMIPLVSRRVLIVIAHRLSTVNQADRIYVLDEGAIIASGPHSDLLESCSQYRRLYQEQFIAGK